VAPGGDIEVAKYSVTEAAKPIEGAEMSEHTDNDLRAELAALRQRLDKLEAEHRQLQRQASGARRPAFSRKFLLTALSVSLLLAAVGVVWGEQAVSLFIDSKGNVGIGTKTPGFPLTFANEPLGDRISLYGQTPGVSYGFGIQGNLLQIHTNQVGADIAFGYGSSGSFTETMRIKGHGEVGIGTTTPEYPLDVRGDFRVMNDDTNQQGFTGRWVAGVAGAAGFTTIKSFNWKTWKPEPLRVDSSVLSLNSSEGGGNVGIGIIKPTEKLDVAGNAKVSGALTASTLTTSGMIKGKLWSSFHEALRARSPRPFFEAWAGGKEPTKGQTKMTDVNNTVCFLTSVIGEFGSGALAHVGYDGGYWYLYVEQAQGRPMLGARAICIGTDGK
jgi:hypothetical protein